jgi:hypothetical protein
MMGVLDGVNRVASLTRKRAAACSGFSVFISENEEE